MIYFQNFLLFYYFLKNINLTKFYPNYFMQLNTTIYCKIKFNRFNSDLLDEFYLKSCKKIIFLFFK